MPILTRSRGQRQTDAPVALVLGGIELIRPLVLAGIECQVVAGPMDATRFSRHATTVFAWDWKKPILDHDRELLERLVRFGERQTQPPVVFFDSDEALLFVSRHRDELATTFRFALGEPDLVESLSDKARFWKLANDRSLPVPPTTILKRGCEASPQDLLHLGFPLILKPARRDLAWDEVDAKGKAVRVDRPEQLREVWPRLAALEGTIIAQRHIDGPESCIESYHVYVDQGGEIAGEFTGRKIRTLPTRYGHTTALTITSAPDVLRLGRDLTRVLGLTGVAKFDFKRGPDGELYLLEVNPRFSLWHHPGARAGVNIPALVYADLTGRARPAVQPESGLHWCHPKDFWAARQSGVPLAQWARWAASCEAKAFWAWDDPLPFLGTAADVVLGRLR